MRVLIIGCGYVGIPLGRRLIDLGHQVWGVRRSEEGKVALQSAGIQLLKLDITNPSEFRLIPESFDWVVNLVSSSRGGLDDYRAVYLHGTKNILEWLSKQPPIRYLYTSSTSVYAQNDGSIIYEKSIAQPEIPTSQVLAQTEQKLLEAVPGLDAIILRVAGIYGPERGHLFKQFLRGEASLRGDGETYLNMIHLEDVVGSIIHLLERGSRNEIYNVCDDYPVTQREFFQWLSKRLGKPMPTSLPADPNRKRGITNKRISNQKLRATGFSLKYPTFREGYEPEIARLKL